MADDFPTATAARNCLFNGNCADAAFWMAKRAAMLGIGMYMLGQGKDLPKRAIAGSLAVQVFVFAWTWLTRNQDRATLPSIDAVEGGNILDVLATYLVRSTMVGLGMYAAGIRTDLVRDSLAGTAMVEMSILVWNGRKGGT